MTTQQPTMIILDVPGTPRGIARLTCCACDRRYPAALSTAATVAQLGERCPPIVCYGCFTTRFGGLGNFEIIGNRESRQRFGLDQQPAE